tara:strand:- start:644 stop:832 length:189 start_codon:yes stop_codon:yes gene_type:complete
MTDKELNQKLETVKKKLKEAHDNKDSVKINYYIKGLNELWEEASKEMLSNAEKEGFIPPKKN